MLSRLRSMLRGVAHGPRLLTSIKDETAHQTEIVNDKLMELKRALDNVADLILAQTTVMRDNTSEITAAIQASNFGLLNEIQSISPAHTVSISTDPLTLDRLRNLPFPTVDINSGDPVAEIIRTIEYDQCNLAVANITPTSLLSDRSKALLYCLVRNMKPALVVEIGSYRAGTSEIICSALVANGHGRLHTIDPFGREIIPREIEKWSADLQRVVDFYPINSMEYFASIANTMQRSDLTFVDGNHDYEFALFDIEAAARAAAPRGFVVIDNIDQIGPRWAARDFIQHARGWRECGGKEILGADESEVPFNRISPIDETDFCVLRAPEFVAVTARPRSLGLVDWPHKVLRGIRLDIRSGTPGTLHLRYIIRIWYKNDRRLSDEIKTDMSRQICESGGVLIYFDLPNANYFVQEDIDVTKVEALASWQGSQPLLLSPSWDFF